MKQHAYWLRDRVKAVPLLASARPDPLGRVHLVDVPDGATLPYVLITPSDGTDEQIGLTGPSGLMQPRFVVHSVGSTYAEVADLSGAIKDDLVPSGRGVTPQIPGEKSHRLWYDSPLPIQKDDDTSPPRLYHVAECGFPSQRVS